MMNKNQKLSITGFCIAVPILILAPISGLLIKGESLAAYLEFPPLTRYVKHAEFSWIVFILLAMLILIVVIPFIVRVLFSKKPEFPLSQGSNLQSEIRNPAERDKSETRPAMAGSEIPNPKFPLWGYAGLILGVLAWILAWNRFEWFASAQRFTFSPLWFSYIIVINAFTYWRSGRCMITERPRFLLMLFVLSAGFWWYFEYLNRFVQNWYYIGCKGLSASQYFWFATLPFSTVLPAVLGTYEFLETIPRLSFGLDDFIKINVPFPEIAAWTVFLASTAGLLGISIWPDYLYPLLWVSPLVILCSLRSIMGLDNIFTPIAKGNWRRIFLLALAALICGFFWEMWNIHSFAKWCYSVPFVNAFHIFEMPILGYAGYLPFGLECAVIANYIDLDRKAFLHSSYQGRSK